MTTSAVEVPEHLRTTFDVYDLGFGGVLDTFNEAVAQLRTKGSVVYSSAHGGHWVVVGYEEAHAILRDPTAFSSYPNNLVNAGDGKFIPIELDPPEHTAYRRVLQPLFSPTRMKALELDVRQLVNQLIDGFAGRGSAEFVSEFAHELPAAVFLKLMGWPAEDGPMFTEMTDIAIQGKPGATDEENVTARQEAAQQMFSYFGTVIAERRAEGGTADVTSEVINTPIEIDGDRQLLSDETLSRMFFLLLIAGLHTVQGSLAWSVLHLAKHAEERRRLIDDPGLIPAAVEEILRFEAAVSMGRRALRDVEVGGVSIKAGDQLVVVLAGANRDRREFSEPDDLQIDRQPNRHLSFGAGPHRCIGSHLARIELRVALEEMHRRIPDYRLDPARPALSHSSSVRGMVQLPILFTPVGSS
ncbi:cytochrome P450 [Mycobacterium sp.]|uniref:cytochrome P450 n=1 Tax=Mycobacterium sp. TaxID=1785 RepID=UPI003BB064DB